MAKIFKRKLIFDNAVFSNFARIKRLDLIYYLSTHIITTKEVRDEVKNGLMRHPILADILDAIGQNQILLAGIEKEENILIAADLIKRRLLGRGEISAMLAAKELGGIFITDDERATKEAVSLGIDILDNDEFRDTVTILKLLKTQGKISAREKRELARMLRKENFII